MYESSSLLVLCIIFVVTRLHETNSAQNRFHSLEPHHCLVSFPNPLALSEAENPSNHCQCQRKMGKKCWIVWSLTNWFYLYCSSIWPWGAVCMNLQILIVGLSGMPKATAAVGQNVLTKCNQGMLPQCKGPGMRLVASEVEVQEYKQIGAMVLRKLWK